MQNSPDFCTKPIDHCYTNPSEQYSAQSLALFQPTIQKLVKAWDRYLKDTDSNYFAFSEDSIEKLIKPEMKEEYEKD